jgi:hypothetical protein
MSRGRIRTVKPEWRLDQRMLRSGHEARIFSIVLLTLADDEGRGLWIESKMAVEAFPFDPDPLASLRSAARGLTPWYLHIYEIDGEGYFQILKFSRHQYIEKLRGSNVPPCPDLEFVPKNGKEPAYYRFPAGVPSSSPPSPLVGPASSSGLSLLPKVSPSPIPDPDPLPSDVTTTRERMPGVYRIVENGLRAELRQAGLMPTDLTSKKWNVLTNWILDYVDDHREWTSSTLTKSLVLGFKDDAKAAAKGWPFPWLVQNPLEYLGKRAGPITREEVEASGTGSLNDEDIIP